MPPEPTMIHATSGACPYCGDVGASEVPSTAAHPHPGRAVLLCSSCGRHSTVRSGGRRYPHDDPSDPCSTIATVVKLRL